MKIETYEDQIVKSICNSLEKEFDRWKPSNYNYNYAVDEKYNRDDNITIAITTPHITIYNVEDANCIIYISKKYNLDRIIESVKKMKFNKEINSGKKLLHKLNIHTRSEKLKNLNEM